MSSTLHPSYANYASPYSAADVMEEGGKEALRLMSKFFSSRDGNIGAGSRWMYENFILKCWLPLLKDGSIFHLISIGETEQKTVNLKLQDGYRCDLFGSLDHAHFGKGSMYLPVFRTLELLTVS